MHKISGKYLKVYKISLKIIFPIPLYHFQSQFSIMGLRVKNSYIIQLNWLYVNYNLVALSPSEAPGASEIVKLPACRILARVEKNYVYHL